MSANLTLALILVLFVGAAPVRAQDSMSEPGRVRLTINDHWLFAADDVERGAALDLPDNTWDVVNLPHTWNARDAFDKEPGYRRGIGWYRKRLANLNPQPGRRYYIYFEGANQIADVYLNGEHVGRHVGGYTAFVVDITDKLGSDGENLLAVRVDNRHNDDVPPLNADFTFFGGIYRDVWLISTNDVHIDVTDHASPGVFVDTPQVSDSVSTARIRGAIVNESQRSRQVNVVSRISIDGTTARTVESRLTIDPGAKAPFELLVPPIDSPLLWSPESPNVYTVTTSVYEGATLLDRVAVPLGFRWFKADGVLGFLLNGSHTRLVGTNRHQDHPGVGSAVSDFAHRNDVRIIKNDGFNFLRLAHYPQDPAVLDETDRAGLVVWEEIPIVNMITLSDEFRENSERMLVEMIRQHYNHPSILMWGYMNEVMLSVPRPLPDGYYEQLLDLARHLESVVEREDPTRATVMAQSVEEVYNGKGLSDVTDILGMNLYFGWYYDTFDSLGVFLDRIHAAHPARPLIVSEYGAGSDERIHTLEPRAFDFSSEHAQNFHLASYQAIKERPYIVGSAVWNQFDFGSESRQDSKNALNQKGLHFYDRRPKDIAFYYRSELLDEPVVHIADEWSRRAASSADGLFQPVRVFSNAPVVELLVDGRSLGAETTANSTADWMVEFNGGTNRIMAVGRFPFGDVVDEAVIGFDDRRALFGDEAESGCILAVNAGTHYTYVDADGIVWEPDQAYDEDTWGHIGGVPRLVHNRITLTDDDPLFQTALDSVSGYRFDVADGSYEVDLLFAETNRDRVRPPFDVILNGARIIDRVSLADEFGRFAAVRQRTEVTTSGGEGIEVRFDPPSSATVSGILIRRK